MSNNSQRRSSKRIQHGGSEDYGKPEGSYNSGTYNPRYDGYSSDNYTAPASSYGAHHYDGDQGSSRVPSGYRDTRNDRYTQATRADHKASKEHTTSESSSRQQREPSHPNFERGIKALAVTVGVLWAYKKADDYFEGGSKKSSRVKGAEDEAARRARKRQNEEVAKDLYYKKQERKKRDAEERRRERSGY